MPEVTYRDLATLSEFAEVVDLERHIWGPGYDEVVPVPILAVSVLRGGILIGAFSGPRMVGFVYSMAGIKHGKPTQWSHMLGVLEEHRNDGTGRRLKLLQRERALAMGLELIEWTYDPMQALNAHLNFMKLGIVVEEYEENVYGTSSSPLHRGNPTDRFVAEWWIAKPHVERRLLGPLKQQGREGGEAPSNAAPRSHVAALTVRTSEVADAGRANRAVAAGEWLACANIDLALDAPRLIVEIPTGFTEMLSRAPDLALEWRMATREIFMTYFGRGYRAVDFFLDRADGRGAYLLTKKRGLGE
jgi:predicted GNAT superfamily acetyltransferase